MWEISSSRQMKASEGSDIRYLRDGRYLACAPTLAGGEAYRIAMDFFRETARVFTGIEMSAEDTFAIMNRIAEESSSQGMIFDPIFLGSKFRGDLERGSISGITTENFLPGPFIRALMEGMIEEVARPYFAQNEQRSHTGLVGAGGAIRRNSALRHVAEVRFGLPLRMSRFDNEAAVGAAMLCED
jgi:sedoheptulokinase